MTRNFAFVLFFSFLMCGYSQNNTTNQRPVFSLDDTLVKVGKCTIYDLKYLPSTRVPMNIDSCSYPQLDKIYQFLTSNLTLVVEIGSHMNPINLSISYIPSQKRAQNIVEYLVNKGIPRDRMVAKGFGEQYVIVSETEIKKMKAKEEKEAARRLNDRIEIRILRSDYIYKPK